MASSRDTSEQQIPLMNGNGGEGGGRDGETVIGGLDDSHSHSMNMNMGGRTVSAGASRGAGGSMIFQEKEQHPAFAIASYCVASILMTVTNKVGATLSCLITRRTQARARSTSPGRVFTRALCCVRASERAQRAIRR